MRLSLGIALGSALSLVSAIDLFVTYQASPGAVSSLTLKSHKGSFKLKEKFNNTGCGQSPTWLTYDHSNDILYCLDENNAGGPGGLYSFDVNDNSSLQAIHHEDVGKGPVASTLYGGKNPQGIVVAEYGKGGYSTFKLDASKPGQFATGAGVSSNITFPPLAQPGPNPKRQDKSYAHDAIVDPTGNYVLIVDLGADKVWTYTYDKTTLGLVPGTVLNVPAGSGPRHAAFWAKRNNGTIDTTNTKLYIVTELSAKVLTYSVTYNANNTLAFSSIGETTATTPPITGNAPGEIVVTHDKKYLLTSNRLTNDYQIPNPDPTNTTSVLSDSLSIFAINPTNGTLNFIETTPSGGISPRQFSLTRDGEYVAVAHYGSGNVAVLKRNPETGKFIKNPIARYFWPAGSAVTAALWNEC